MEEKRHLFCHFWLETFHVFNLLITQQGITVFFAMFALECSEEIIYRNHFDWWSLSVSSVWFLLISNGFLWNGQSVNANSVLIRAFCRLLWVEIIYFTCFFLLSCRMKWLTTDKYIRDFIVKDYFLWKYLLKSLLIHDILLLYWEIFHPSSILV
jgi:hypothetical protein